MNRERIYSFAMELVAADYDAEMFDIEGGPRTEIGIRDREVCIRIIKNVDGDESAHALFVYRDLYVVDNRDALEEVNRLNLEIHNGDKRYALTKNGIQMTVPINISGDSIIGQIHSVFHLLRDSLNDFRNAIYSVEERYGLEETSSADIADGEAALGLSALFGDC